MNITPEQKKEILKSMVEYSRWVFENTPTCCDKKMSAKENGNFPPEYLEEWFECDICGKTIEKNCKRLREEYEEQVKLAKNQIKRFGQ